ncbi:HD domain-containing protein [Naumannella halotolerans]|uniref:HD domain-containing protein n=1 Tax=Naumannella halotolerans TaxID=993414 RepID=A0A4R7IWN3_9ACTN|nr:HD domain-containing protein [Naumannella halotolerans]TDT29081.1 HD domain-containing protein [Naumannella halotolerans]
MSDLVQRAESISRRAHEGQSDKAGEPYAEHPARVAERVADRVEAADRDLAVSAAWLHDVVEDTDVTLDSLREDVGSAVSEIVDALTKRPGEPREDYYERIRTTGHLAVTVKLADLDDNTDPARLAALAPEVRERLEAKYRHTRAELTRSRSTK